MKMNAPFSPKSPFYRGEFGSKAIKVIGAGAAQGGTNNCARWVGGSAWPDIFSQKKKKKNPDFSRACQALPLISNVKPPLFMPNGFIPPLEKRNPAGSLPIIPAESLQFRLEGKRPTSFSVGSNGYNGGTP